MISVNGSGVATLSFQSSPPDNKLSGEVAAVSNDFEVANRVVSPEVKISKVELTAAIEMINQAIIPRSLNFREDESSGRSVITVVDKTNDEVIRQIPAEEVLKVSREIKRLQEEMAKSVGVLIDSQV